MEQIQKELSITLSATVLQTQGVDGTVLLKQPFIPQTNGLMFMANNKSAYQIQKTVGNLRM